MQDAKSQEKQLSHGYTKWYLASQSRQEGWVEDNSPIFFGQCAESSSSVAQWNSWGIIFKHFSWKAAFYSPMGVCHIPTAGWHTAGVWKRLYIHFLCRLILGTCGEKSVICYSTLFPGTSARLRNSELRPTLAFQSNKHLTFFYTSEARCLPHGGSWILFIPLVM